MIFSKSRPVKIVLVGTGGTGGYIVPQLYRLLYALDRPIRVILCDGDLVEEKNLGRQNFIEADLGKNKAMVLAERYSNAFGIETSYIPQYVEDEEMLEELLEPLQYPQNRYVTNQNVEAVRKVISEIVILIGAVDNNRSRQVFHSVFQRAKELIYIDSGNSKASGQVICGVRRSGKTFYQPVASLYKQSSPNAKEESGMKGAGTTAPVNPTEAGKAGEAIQQDQELMKAFLARAGKGEDRLADDFDFLKLKAMYVLLKDVGYTIRLKPMTDPPSPAYQRGDGQEAGSKIEPVPVTESAERSNAA